MGRKPKRVVPRHQSSPKRCLATVFGYVRPGMCDFAIKNPTNRRATTTIRRGISAQSAWPKKFISTNKRCEKRCNRRFMPSRWIPSIHMNRWASRLTLIVEALRFCRLQEISAAEAIAGGTGVKEVPNPQARHQPRAHEVAGAPPGQFGSHWDSLYRKPGHRLVDNPEVVSLTFSVHRGNIDHLFKNDQDDH